MKILKMLMVLVFPLSAFAAPQFTGINEADMKEITKGMGANFVHNSMLGASKMGTVFGFQLGVVAAKTDTPEVHKIAKRTGGELKNLYNAGLMGAVGIPFGIAFEATVMPTAKSDDASARGSSFALKWNINDVIPILPVNLALRGVSSNAEFSFNQTVGAQTAKVKNTTAVTGLQLLLSPQIPLIEPYVGVGTLSSKNKLEWTGSAGTIFDPTYTTATEKSETVSGTQILAGVDVNLLLLKIGLEYSKAFDNSRVGFKLGIGF